MAGITHRATRSRSGEPRPARPDAGKAEGSGADRCAAADARLAGLIRTIESEVIPRLVLAHRGAPGAAAPPASDGEIHPDDVAEFCDLVLRDDLDALLHYVQVARNRGVPLERVYLDLLSPVARRLGDLWLADECDFTTVTLGLWRLHQVLHELSPAFQDDGDPLAEGKRVLLAATPGEQHTFGLFMVAEFFRRAGWDVMDGPAFTARELVAAVRHDWFSLAGFSLSGEAKLRDLAALIRDVRQGSRNRAIAILVGGAVFRERPQLVAEVGADACASDGREAVRLAESMLMQRQRRCAD